MNLALGRRAVLLGGAAITLLPTAAFALEPTIAHVTSPRVLGKDDAPIKVVELFSMTCSHCASFHNNTFPDVKKRLIDTGMVRFEMQPFPLDQIALRGHVLARALPKNKYFSPNFDNFFGIDLNHHNPCCVQILGHLDHF